MKKYLALLLMMALAAAPVALAEDAATPLPCGQKKTETDGPLPIRRRAVLMERKYGYSLRTFRRSWQRENNAVFSAAGGQDPRCTLYSRIPAG